MLLALEVLELTGESFNVGINIECPLRLEVGCAVSSVSYGEGVSISSRLMGGLSSII